ncbi:MAG TPA: NAD(P)H-dependent oxidoreductase [Candidatus Saccharibacteria bacterium]|jgi:azobenzene reductase|nr:NAD(P)H-dependent oxidoreductase [Candidatus Saccharibacteria bacterium]
MKIAIICASMRAESQSLKVSKWLKENAPTDIEIEIIDLHKINLPLFDDSDEMRHVFKPVSHILQKSEGFIFVSPEWNGMVSHGLINMLHFCQDRELAYKPVMLVGVSSGRGGTHPLDQMKLIGQKNRHYIISPENLIISGVKDVMNDNDMKDASLDSGLKRRAVYGVNILGELARALTPVRLSTSIDFDHFGNGV